MRAGADALCLHWLFMGRVFFGPTLAVNVGENMPCLNVFAADNTYLSQEAQAVLTLL